MPKGKKSKIPRSSGESVHSPIWSVTRRQRTELSPRRDDETGSTQTFSSRTVTTTERIQMIPVPDNFDTPMDVLIPIDKSERYFATTTITNESHSIPIISGITVNGVPLYTGLYTVPKTTETKEVRTMMTTTTTTTYSIIEIDDSEEELKVETEEKTIPESTQITLDFPLDYEVVDFKDLVAESSEEEKEHLYVVVGKKDSPTRTTDAADYVVKMIDIDLPSSQRKGWTSIERIPDAESERLKQSEAEGYIERHDYDAYEGTVASTSRTSEIDQKPINQYVTVYHNGVSPGELDLEEKRINKEISTVVAKLSGAYKRASIEGEHTIYTDAKTEQITQQETQSASRQIKESPQRLKSTYTVRFSDPFRIEADDYSWIRQENQRENILEKAKKGQKQARDQCKRQKEQQTTQRKRKDIKITEETRQKKTFAAAKITTGLFKKDETYLDYPAMETYEGPVDSIYRIQDVESEPIEHLVTVYHSGRSDEFVPMEEKKPSVDVGEVFTDAAQALGAKITGLFKRGPAHLDYPTSGPYDGPLASTSLAWDVEGEPLQQHDVESEPIEHLVTVYHSGRSDEFVPMEEKKPSVDVGEVFTDAAQALGAKITGLFKRGPAHLDYPTSGPYDGPLASTSLAWDVEGEPLQQHVSVYHSGRSDEPMTKIVEIPTEISLEEVPVVEKPTVTAKIITGLFKKDETYLDYPAMETYEGPVDSIYRIQDVESEPIEHLVTVYHSGRSDEFVPMEEKKPSVDVGEVFTDAAQALGAKITGLFKRGPAHLDYPTSGPYDGPLASTSLAWDVEGEPLQQHVSVYHSGRSDEPMTKIVEIPTEISLEEVPVDVLRDHSVSETYVGPLSHLPFSRDVECLPLQLFVNIYHSGRSDLMPGELPFHFFAREDKISDTKVESRLYPPFKDTDFHDRMFQFDNVKPLVPPCTAAYAGNEYKICRPLEPPTSPSKPEHRANDFDISISGRIASGRTLPVGIAHPVPKISEIPKSRHYDEIAEVRRSEVTSTPHDFDYHRKTREVDYWIGRRSERQSKPYRDLTADIGIDLASDVGWEERNIFETQPLETTGIRQSARDYSTYPSKVRARKVSPTAHLHWTTVSEKTSISYKKRISIERRRPHQTSSPQLATYRRQYRPPPPPPEVSAYARHDRAVFESSTLPRTYAGVAIEGDLRMQRARYEASSLPSSYYSSTETRIERNPVRYDLPRPSTPPRYEYWAGERNKWTVEGSPKQFSITDQNGHSAYDDYYMKRTKQEALHYQKSNLEEIPIISLIKDLPMIEDGADECSCASILPASRIETQDLPPGEHSRPSRSAPLRRARQRIRNLCTML
ncbi:hypothetical protein LOAG_18294 [Loa loa]|uniref:Uncharacterized protein n=1 Tax=Loa loa TaxID=7209 RepID=A0A1S0UG41_LOALO|nr:hypothetical protein LOAG_18294 [Loa loa]EJD74386.1 hypothetical protein LOAG_18294 [Loa loa]